jgi:aspartyl-tRNA(Asn)/glutamyl-tRNA(Gln) amidotransferase subunit C
MKVTETDVANVAELANLELTAEERTAMLRDLNSILDYIDLLNALDTSNVDPMAQLADLRAVDASLKARQPVPYPGREDILEGLRKSLPQEVALENAPESDGSFFIVPKVIER